MHVLLTGASGFVGSYVLAKLLEDGHQVAVLLRPQSNRWRIKPLLEKCVVMEQNLESIHLVQEAVTAFAPEALIHTAWYGVTHDQRNNPDQINRNLILLNHLFYVAQTAGVKTIIGFGSQAEYGPVNRIINEQQPTHPTTLYGVAKLAAYHLLDVLCAQHNIRFVWHRLFSAYGPKDAPSWFIPFLIRKLMNHEEPELTAGTQLWDFIFVEDVAKAVMDTLNSQASGIFNLGSGKAYPIKTIAELIANYINPQISLGFGKMSFRQDQVMHLEADISRLNKQVGWRPKMSLTEGLKQTMDWYKNESSSQ